MRNKLIAITVGALGLASVTIGVRDIQRVTDALLNQVGRSTATVRELDDVVIGWRDAQGAAHAEIALRLESLRDEARDPAERAALEAAMACIQAGPCPEIREHLKPAHKVATQALESEWAKFTRERKAGQMKIGGGCAGLVAALILAAFVASNARASSTRELETLLKQRLEELYATRLRALETDRFATYGELAAGLHHGLKTPLATIRACAQVALTHLPAGNKAQSKLEEVISEVDQLVDQIQRFLKAIGPGSATMTPVAPQQILLNLDAQYSAAAAGRGIGWSSQCADHLALLRVDPALLEVALRNLVENALAATPSGARVEVRAASCTPPERAGLDNEPTRGGDWVELTITDEGPGVPDSVVQGAPARTTKAEGSGLGIAIAKRIVARHGGSLSFERGKERGTIARVKLPINAAEPQSGEAAA